MGTRAASRTAMTPFWLIIALLSPFAESDDCPGAAKLYGRIEVVESFADCEVQAVESFPDLRVQLVDSFADDPGECQMVENFPDYTVTFVESFPDVKIEYVDSFPGPTD
ncbi:hypothetical protein BSZ37_13585 [Rubrivirga marina]|uniref:7(1) septoil knot domain-containing protein n=2 Tax=Rubrivirga marina TaxID=1196024 RepID=A0A271J2X0_9BACT|nr:hypothetical protein BSZ37_13585 [Rubrivirga marina]